MLGIDQHTAKTTTWKNNTYRGAFSDMQLHNKASSDPSDITLQGYKKLIKDAVMFL